MLGTLDIKQAATQAAGNWQKFDSFAWFRQRELEDPEQWSIIYTHHRDSGLIDQSNAAVIAETMKPFCQGEEPDVVAEHHGHFAVGHIDGFSVRVFDDLGNITPAFCAYHELAARIDDYPILDDEDYSEREFEATLANIEDSAWRLKREFHLPEDWVEQVQSWLADNDPSQLENTDDQGGYPSEASLRAAFEALGFKERE